MKIAIGITGASGTIYAERLLHYLVPLRESGIVAIIAVIFTRNGREVATYERPNFLSQLDVWISAGIVIEYRNDDFFTPIASGSAGFDAMVVVPCSMGMTGRIAGGISDDLISRAADVMLKENSPLRPKALILCPRETPLSLVHLRNLTTISEAGGVVLPAMPSFYSHPVTPEEAADTVVARIMAQLGLGVPGSRGWQE